MRSLRNKERNVQGFTLIELLVVISIIGILSTVVLNSLGTARLKGRDATRISDLKQIQLALELYFESGNNAYPAALSNLSPQYVQTVPRDPRTGSNYIFEQTGSGTGYHVGALLELSNDILLTDADATTTSFGGATSDCATTGITVAANERCYDISQ